MQSVVDRPTHRVGRFDFRIVPDEGGSTPVEIEQTRAKRVEAIARWLRSQWEREQQRRIAERN